MDDLFNPPEIDTYYDANDLKGSFARCACGEVYNTDYPIVCKCGQTKLFWRMMDGKIKNLKQMDLGHLTNIVRMLAAKIEDYPVGSSGRAIREQSMDLFYAEIASRDKEIAQLTGIMNALTRKRQPADAE